MQEFISGILNQFGVKTTDFGIKFVGAILVLIIGIAIAKGIAKLISKSSALKGADPSLVKFVASFVRLILEASVIIGACLIIGIPASSFIAILGSAGLAIGLALQGSLTNLAGGIVIMIFKPFRVGDFVDVCGVSGTVETINVFNTIINTLDNKKVTVPNGSASNTVVVNYSANDLRRVDLNFSVAYGSDTALVRKVLTDTALAHELSLSDPAPVVLISSFNESSISFELRVWCKSGDYWPVHNDLMETVSAAFKKNGVKVPFNQLDVHISNN